LILKNSSDYLFLLIILGVHLTLTKDESVADVEDIRVCFSYCMSTICF